MEIAGQTVMVIGGTSGIGRTTAQLLARQGARVVIAGREQIRVDAALATLAGEQTGAVVDATDANALVAFFAALGPFDHLILCVSSGQGSGPFATLTQERLRGAFDGKFWAYFGAVQTALPTLRGDGSLTFVTAASAHSSLPNTVGLAAVNGAIEAMVPPLANELRPLRVNAVSPGVIDTPYWERVSPAVRDALRAEAATLPVGRIGQAEDVAEAIVMLVRNPFITGSVIACDGGAPIHPSATA